MYFIPEPMQDNLKFWNTINSIKIDTEIDTVKYDVVTITVPKGGKKKFDEFFEKLHKQNLFKSRSVLIYKLLIYFSAEEKNIQFWGHVASWYLRLDKEISVTDNINTKII